MYGVIILFYLVTLVILALFLGKQLNRSKQNDDVILLSLMTLPLLCPFSFSLYFSTGTFSIFALLTFILGTVLFILSLENKHTIIITLLLLFSLIMHPVIFLILFPTAFVLFLFNNPNPKALVMLQIIILIVCYLVDIILLFLHSASLIITPKTLLGNLLDLFFLMPVIFLIFYVFITALKEKMQKKSIYYLSLFLFVFPIPLVFICNSFYIYLSASLGGQMILLLCFYLRSDPHIVNPLKKIQTFFSKNIPAFLLFVFYLTYLSFVLENHLGFIGDILRNNYL
ncbi:hypothetical protein SDC9_139577 [bioreactor metagenome]|uniref:Uncharacterized protein n=1 Tax=bioreactor metagenome TaxID=1076179 RepID=A0A645DVR7_9ZZZZ